MESHHSAGIPNLEDTVYAHRVNIPENITTFNRGFFSYRKSTQQ